jgi:protein gp37
VTWNDQARSFQIKNKRRQRVFCASLADVFDNQVDWVIIGGESGVRSDLIRPTDPSARVMMPELGLSGYFL